MKILYYIGWTLTRIFSKLRCRIRVSGRENIPREGGFILAGNHLSYFDPLLLGSWATRQVYFMAKQELFENPLFGGIIRRTNALPLRRGTIDRAALDNCVEVIERGFGLTVFPEGTRARQGRFLDPKPGVGMVAVRCGCPIVPAYIHGSNRLGACFGGGVRLSITFGPPLEAAWIGTFDATKESYIEIAQVVMKRIAALRDCAPTAKKSDQAPDH